MTKKTSLMDKIFVLSSVSAQSSYCYRSNFVVMRIWSIHPKYLDSKGLVALWRETLLAKNVLEGKTKGYKNHPQLNRFKRSENPLASINVYLQGIYNESVVRSFQFDKSKFAPKSIAVQIVVTDGQMQHEVEHLKKKLKAR